MTTNKMTQAKDWAAMVLDMPTSELMPHAAQCAAEVLRDLPDVVVDGTKLQELADDMTTWQLPDGPSTAEDDLRKLHVIIDEFTDRALDLLHTPTTLADMYADQVSALAGKQVYINGEETGKLLEFDEHRCAVLVTHDNSHRWPEVVVVMRSEVTPTDWQGTNGPFPDKRDEEMHYGGHVHWADNQPADTYAKIRQIYAPGGIISRNLEKLNQPRES